MQIGPSHSNLTRVSSAGELHLPAGVANGRAALVLHEAPGITSNVQRRCAMLAALGYVAFAPDLHRSDRGLSPAEVRAAIDAFRLNPERLRSRVEDSLAYLCDEARVVRQRVAVVGYCFGGMAALELARSGADVAAVASFHGLLGTKLPAAPGQVRAPLLVCTGGRDELVPPQDVLSFQQEMTAANARWELIVYGQARHSFTNADATKFGDPRMRHDPYADRKSWAALQEFLAFAYA